MKLMISLSIMRQRCENCVISNQLDPSLDNPDVTICVFCRAEKNKTPIDYRLKTKQLLESLEKLKQSQRDSKNPSGEKVILGFSGGKDSLYGLIFLLEHGIRPLLAIFDSGFQSESGKQIIEQAITKFKLQSRTYRPPMKAYRHCVKTLFQATGDLCLQCDLEVYRMLLTTAHREKIRTIVMGGGASEGLGQSSPLRALDVYTYAQSFLNEKGCDSSHIQMRKDEFESIEWIQLGDFIQWNHSEIFRKLNQYGFKLPDHYIHHDCQLCRLHDLARFKKRGFNRNEPSLAALVRNGTMQRHEALELIETEEAKLKNQMKCLESQNQSILRALSISDKTWENVLADPRISYSPPWYQKKTR